MGKRKPEWFDDDDFNEPDYDKLSDEELDDLYYYGEIRSVPKPKEPVSRKPAANQVVQQLFPDDEDDDWLDDDDDLYEDD